MSLGRATGALRPGHRGTGEEVLRPFRGSGPPRTGSQDHVGCWIRVVISDELEFCCHDSVQGSDSFVAFSKGTSWNLPFELQCLDASLVFMFILLKLLLGESTQQCLLGK